MTEYGDDNDLYTEHNDYHIIGMCTISRHINVVTVTLSNSTLTMKYTTANNGIHDRLELQT